MRFGRSIFLTCNALVLVATLPSPAVAAPTKATTRAARNDIVVPKGVVDPVAVEALKNMSRFLMSLQTLQLDTNGSLDVVTADGQRVQIDGSTTYKVKRPGFVIRYVGDTKVRDFYYDGK